jgi:S-DNA-T family DNA segregation ATPase FtsK/SpoIIIE
MLFLPIDASKPTRIQGAYIDEKDTGKVAEFLRTQAKPEYSAEVIEAAEKGPGGGDDEVSDELFEKALDFVLSTNYASTSMLQRKLRIGYTRAARLMDLMEARGYVGPADGSKPREILKTRVFETPVTGAPTDDVDDEQPDDDPEDQ